MNTAVITMRSQALGRHVSYSAIIPDSREAGPGPYAVLYQLHGASDDHSAWINRSNLARYMAKIPIIAILPDGGLSFWMNAGPRERYEDFMMQDLPEHVSNTFNVKPGKAVIGGLSMGGFGSLRLALKYPECFASVWAHSSALLTQEEWLSRPQPLSDIADADIYALAVSVKGKELPVISLDCGTEDRLLSHNRRFHRHLADLGIPHQYKEHSGAHTWDYWDVHVKEALNQHARVLGLEVSA
jgi:putative tributyrin esterase